MMMFKADAADADDDDCWRQRDRELGGVLRSSCIDIEHICVLLPYLFSIWSIFHEACLVKHPLFYATITVLLRKPKRDIGRKK